MSVTATKLKNTRAMRRKRRVRAKMSGTAERPRISVVRSNRGVSAQLIDDIAGTTLVAVNWTEADLRKLSGIEQATKAGELLAERAKKAGVEAAVFDRNGFLYHGRVQAFADGVRSGGLTV
jgi:large subunit ribosomal protein L18